MGTLLGLLFIWVVIYVMFKKQFDRRSYLKKVSKSGITEIDSMPGVQFEDYLLTLFRKLGYHVTQTKASGDFGADLILQKDGTRIVVQAKRYAKPVSVRAVQEAHSSLSIYGASAAWVVTNNYFTAAAIKLAKSNSVKLIDRDELMKLIISTNNSR